MKKLFFILAALCSATMFAAPDGAINGKFSVSADKQVFFASGNLQYRPYYGDWQFAEHQWNVIGADNSNAGDIYYKDYLDLFGWGASGYNDCYPYLATTVSSDYGPATGDIAGTDYDWGSVAESMDLDPIWRTLTKDEWDYLLNTRTNAANLRTKYLVHGVGGLILLPDNWDLDARPLSAISDDTWATWESLGAVFLPSTGYRTGTTPKDVSTEANYWTSTRYSSDATTAYHLYVPASGDPQMGHSAIYYGMAVRLAADAVTHKVTINTENCDVTVEPTGINLDSVDFGTQLILTAVPNTNYRFKEWVNYDPAMGLRVTSDTTVTARCALLWTVNIEEVAGGNVKAYYKGTDTQLTAEQLAAVPHETQLTLVATPNEGYVLQKWNFTDGNENTINITVRQDLDVRATFIDKNTKFSVTPVADPVGSCNFRLSDTELDMSAIPFNTVVTVIFEPAEGYRIRGIDMGSNSDCMVGSTETSISLRVLRDISFRVICLPVTHIVTFSAAPSPSLAPSPAQRAPMAFAGGHVECVTVPTSGEPREILSGSNVEHGTVLRFTAVPDALGWTLDYWSTGPATGNSKEVTIDNDYTIVAYFKEAAMYTLTLEDDGNGVVTIFNGTPGEEVYSAAPINVLEGQEIILTAHPNVGYEFDHWDNYTDPYFDEDLDVWVVPAVTGNTTIKAYFREKATETLAEGAIGGLFTVGVDSEGKPVRVQFSQGNLQYIAGDGKTHKVADETLAESSLARRGTWQFAEEQIDYIGSKNNNAAEDYDEPIDIFCFGASGFDSRYPWLKTTSALYQDISATNYDWGVFNAISNGGNEPGLWRMLTKDEVDYMLYQRGNHSNCVYWGRQLHGIGTANGEAGLFLMPDGWVMPGELAKENITFLPLEVEDYTTNKFKSTAWTVLEQSGVVFLPAGGARFDMGGGVTVYAVGQAVYCQVSTYQDEGMAYACIWKARPICKPY